MNYCVSLTKLKAEDCALIDNSTINDNASECFERCRLSQQAYALISQPRCLCVGSEFFKLAEFLKDTINCQKHLCLADSTDCGGYLSDSGQTASDCRYTKNQILRYSSFIRNASGMPARVFWSFLI